MPQSNDKRNDQLARFKHLLNTTEGKLLMVELRDTWDGINLLGDDTQKTGYNVGLRDAYKFMEMIQNGDLIHE